MSFANYDLEAQTDSPKKQVLSSSSSSSQNTETDLDSIIRKTSHQIQTYGSLVASFNNEKKLLGSRRDDVQLRRKLASSQQNIVSLGSAIRKLIADITVVMSDSSSESEIKASSRQHMMKDRLSSDFRDLESNFDKAVQYYTEKTARAPLQPQKNTNTGNHTESSPLLSQNEIERQAQLQIQEDQDTIEQTELQYHMLLTEERNRQIEQVAEGIREVNSIFKDLGELVNQQGEQLDTVEENVLQMSGNAHEASRELNTAHEYQKRKSKWSCILLVALCVFVLVMVLMVVS
ncbi:hypothetical protein OXX69_002222 [Metschnikowia pulcherrima]